MAERSSGFTLVEMLAAIAILTMGLTGLIGLMSTGVSTRATAEMRDRAVRAADVVLQLLDEGRFAAEAADAAAGQAASEAPIPGFPRLRARVERTVDPQSPELELVTVRVSWQEEGTDVFEVFRRVRDRSAPFPARIRQLKEQP